MSDDAMRALFQGSAEDEERFKYEVIRGLSDSVRQLAGGMADMQRTQVGMLERLAKLEANKFGEALIKTETKVDEMDKRVDVLFREKDRRDGAGSFLAGMFKYGPAIFSLLTMLYLFGRSLGVVPSPPTTATIAPPVVIERREGSTTEGTKP